MNSGKTLSQRGSATATRPVLNIKFEISNLKYLLPRNSALPARHRMIRIHRHAMEQSPSMLWIILLSLTMSRTVRILSLRCEINRDGKAQEKGSLVRALLGAREKIDHVSQMRPS